MSSAVAQPLDVLAAVASSSSDSSPEQPAAAAAAAAVPAVRWGALWSLHSTRKRKHSAGAWRPELAAYDVCMVFLDRPGCYYKADQRARQTRGEMTADSVTASLRRYYALLPDGTTRRDGEITCTELSSWWWMDEQTRAWVRQRDEAYDFAHAAFVRCFQPKRVGPKAIGLERRFFSSLCSYAALLLSLDVELQRAPGQSSSAFCYGVFARRQLSSGMRVAALSGYLVCIKEEEEAALLAADVHHSVLHMERGDIIRAFVPEELDNPTRAREKRAKRRASEDVTKRVREEPRASAASTAQELVRFVVAGGVSFLNHACAVHCNACPCVYRDDNDVGLGQWKLVSVSKDVKIGEELWLDYGGGERQQPYRIPCPHAHCSTG